jgi:Domain of unknown function (DUF4190)
MSFCPEDGMILVDPSLAGIKTSADPSSGPPSQDPTLLFPPPVQPGSWATPDVETSTPPPWAPAVQTPPVQPWRPPPPPTYVKPPSQGLGIASMIVGILGMLFGVLCFGPVIGIVALVLGIIALTQNKKMPQHVGGRAFAIVGIVTGGLSLLIYGGLMLFFIFASNL